MPGILLQFLIGTFYASVSVHAYIKEQPKNTTDDDWPRRKLSNAKYRISDGEAAIKDLMSSVSKLYGVPEDVISADIKWYAPSEDKKLVDSMLRSIVHQDKFVVSVGGMSDTAGHGNLASEAYPIVMLEALRPIFASIGVTLIVRNFAMGGLSSLLFVVFDMLHGS
jgi:hypothetical protein